MLGSRRKNPRTVFTIGLTPKDSSIQGSAVELNGNLDVPMGAVVLAFPSTISNDHVARFQ